MHGSTAAAAAAQHCHTQIALAADCRPGHFGQLRTETPFSAAAALLKQAVACSNLNVVSMLEGWYSRLTGATHAPPVFQSLHYYTASRCACQVVCKMQALLHLVVCLVLPDAEVVLLSRIHTVRMCMVMTSTVALLQVLPGVTRQNYRLTSAQKVRYLRECIDSHSVTQCGNNG